MLRLAVTTNAETFARIREPLANRGIESGHLQAKERSLPLTADTLTASPDTEGDTTPAAFDVGLVYPGRLMEGAAITAGCDIPWVNGREAVLTSRNKGGVIAALDAAEIPVPESVMLSNPVDDSVVADAVADLSFPVVIKPNSATRGIGVAKAGDLDSLLGVVDYLDLVHDFRSTGDKSYLIQEFLADARDYRAMVIDGECVGGVERRLPDSLADGRWKHNVHRGAEATGVDLPDAHRRLAEQTAAELGVPYLGVDLLETADRLVVTETNARPTVDDAAKYDDGFYDRLAGLIRETAEKG
jgi:SSU ribosomal protein S6P modification protein